MAMMKLDANEMSAIDVLDKSTNLVLLVHQRNCSHPIVVKSEDTLGRQNVGAMLEFHATAFSKLRALPFDTERLSLQEIEHLKKCDPGKINLNPKPTQAQWLVKLNDLLYGTNNETGVRDAPNAVVKLSYVEALADVMGMAEKHNEQQQLRSLLEQGGKKAHECIFAVGQILAVDFFIGNHDRFKDGVDRNPIGAILGSQNVFFSFKNGEIRPVGLDTLDPTGKIHWSNMTETIEALETKIGTKWPGRILSPGSKRRRDDAAANLVSSLASEVGANLSRTVARRLRRECHKGISDGKIILRRRYNLGSNLSALSAGIASRWSIIGGR